MTNTLKQVAVSVEDVAFAYPDRADQPVISNVSMVVEPGQSVALIGASGAGKSTLASLILGLLEPTQGQITLNGLAPREYVVSNPGAVSLVEQSTSLVRGSIASNVALGCDRDSIDNEILNWALEAAELSEWVNGLPNGSNSDIDPAVISGGQLQRIGLARALFTKPSLLVLDEPTSALDADTEYRISKTLEKMRGQITQISIAHRLTTIESADVVFLLVDGTITDRGTFSELRKSSAVVAGLVSRLTFKN
jgi:ATP-binding cassette, subfamily B, bacterial PglK